MHSLSIARAETTSWSETVAQHLYQTVSLTLHRHYKRISNPHVRVLYGTQVFDEATGGAIPCGSSVPQGTRLRFEFIPHTYTDIYWTGTGTSWDTPYGSWASGAERSGEIICQQKNLIMQENGTRRTRNYAELSVAPPTKSLGGLDQYSCTQVADSQTCTMSAVGIAPVTFDFAPTLGQFYFGYDQNNDGRSSCGNGGTPLPLETIEGSSANYVFFYTTTAEYNARMHRGHVGVKIAAYPDPVTPFIVNVPAQSISCPITVTEVPDGNNPPSLDSLDVAGACTVGVSHTVSMTSTDNDVGAQVQYLIDWGNPDVNGVWAQSGVWDISSSTNPGSYASQPGRIYSTAGTKTVTVKAVDNHGASSEERTVSFLCAAAPNAEVSPCDGNASCGGSDNGGRGSVSSTPKADLSIRAVPSLVKSGRTTKINWSATNVQPDSCTVTSPNGDAWTSTASSVGGELSRPITGETIYTLSCTDLDSTTQTKTAKVRTLPSFREL